MCKAQQQEIDALTNLESATEKELDLARLRLIDLGVDAALRKHILPKDDDLPVAFNPSTGTISANGLTLQLDVEELIYTGDLLLHVITGGRKCGHRIKQVFGGFDAEYRKPKYCPSCKAERRRIKAEKVWEEYKQIWPEAATAGDSDDEMPAWPIGWGKSVPLYPELDQQYIEAQEAHKAAIVETDSNFEDAVLGLEQTMGEIESEAQ